MLFVIAKFSLVLSTSTLRLHKTSNKWKEEEGAPKHEMLVLSQGAESTYTGQAQSGKVYVHRGAAERWPQMMITHTHTHTHTCMRPTDRGAVAVEMMDDARRTLCPRP